MTLSIFPSHLARSSREMLFLRRSLGGDELGVAVLLSGWLALLLLLLVGVVPSAPVVVLGEDFLVDLGQHALLEESEEIPSGIERLENVTAAVLALLQEIGLELLEEDQEVLVISGEGVLTDDSLHGQCIFTRGVEGVHLREDGWMIVTGELMAVLFDTDGRLHQTRQRGKHIDGRVDLSVVQLPESYNFFNMLSYIKPSTFTCNAFMHVIILRFEDLGI